MAKRSRKLTPKTSKENKQNQPRAGARKRVVKKTFQKPKPGSWLSSTLAIAILLSSAGLIITFAWISFLFILNPDQVSWMNKILPTWAQIPLGKHERPQTFKNIELNLTNKNLIVGELLPLYQDTKNSFFMPVFQQRANCESDCQKLVEIRVYQRSQELEFKSEPENYYYLESQLSITGPEESFVISSLADATLEPQDISVPLPLTKVQRFEGQTPSPGVWFNLRGERQQGTSTLAYGYIVYYNPERSNLQQMLSWTSPTGQLPKWQQVTGDATKELVIDGTLGLEPRLEVYQVKPLKLFLKPIQLEAINLKSPVLKDSGYQNALSIARTGLWTPAFEWLKFIKKQRKGLPQEAQAQMDLIRLHSQLTKSQAEKSWASPGEQVLADLIDGRWGKALQVFESAHNVQEIATLLRGDEKRLWNRTVAALRVNPNRQEVQAWFALILAVQRGQEAANSWLETQPQITKDRLAYIQRLLAKLDGEVTKSQISHPSQIVGTVQSIAEVTSSEWLQPNSTADLKLTDNQVWYQVQVSAFSDGKRWLNFPFEDFNPPKTSRAKFFWETLGINSDSQMQIVVWLPNGEQQITIATIKAVQLRNKVLRLLVAAPKIPENQNNVLQPKPLALTNAALEWVQPFPITLRELHAQNPSAVKVILSSVWESLQKSGEVPAGAIPSFEQMQDKLGDWPVQTIDLTNNGQPEIILTISGATIASLNQPQPGTGEENTNQSPDRTIILSDSDEVIYTDFQQNSFQKLSAIAKLSGVQSLALLVENADRYSLMRWSDKNQRFE
ncbi:MULTISPECIES: hypothetical protein [Nostoc]|uniref:Uncharacterized protein n=1 Tax=Nostoc paludosum FACHB-159 TaxID=2692908 RepID=A0ABR8KF12_9NOSO|nr:MULTISPECIES: hypothetical protein [Nostoc]MBD2679697.1 hypothetical protein [Nostoc sp. FACHB-857]MBD2736687.1 hypothetical protein [Nostoc paludosum FACHB-159]